MMSWSGLKGVVVGTWEVRFTFVFEVKDWKNLTWKLVTLNVFCGNQLVSEELTTSIFVDVF